MLHIFKYYTLDQAEVWATFIPLIVLKFRRKQPYNLRPVIIYLWIALFINLTGNIIAEYKVYLPSWLQSNNPLYNVNSLIRFTCFGVYFELLKQPFYKIIRRSLPVVSLFFVVINFSFFQDFFYPLRLSSRLLTVEAYLLLIYCMLYYLSQLKEDVQELTKLKDFWITTGMSFYVVINFFVFLYYDPLYDQNSDLADRMWDFHNVAYIILCSLTSKAFYVPYNK